MEKDPRDGAEIGKLTEEKIKTSSTGKLKLAQALYRKVWIYSTTAMTWHLWEGIKTSEQLNA